MQISSALLCMKSPNKHVNTVLEIALTPAYPEHALYFLSGPDSELLERGIFGSDRHIPLKPAT